MLNLCLMMLDSPGEEELFLRIYYRYRNLMYYVAFDILRNAEDAEEAVQDAFLKIAMSFPQPALEDPESKHARNLCAIITKYQAIDQYRRLKKHRNNEMLTDSLEIDEMLIRDDREQEGFSQTDYTRWANQDTYFEDERPYEKILEIIRELPERYTDVMYFYLVQGKTRSEIAFELALPVSTVKKRLERGKALLKERIQKSEGVDLDE